MAFEEILRARVPKELKTRILRLLRQPEHRGREEADLVRIAIEDYCAAQEQALRMKPITEDEVNEFMAMLVAERGSSPVPRGPAEPNVSYKQRPKGNTGRPRKLPGHQN